MNYTALLNTIGLILFIIAFGWAVSVAEPDRPDWNRIADCIAEYDYHHPERTQMDNLVIALKECQP